jgi:SRSO17 transposase
MARIAHRFGRVEPRRRVPKLILGLLAGLPRANCWTIAEHAGEAAPDGMQHLLARAVWDHDAVCEDLREYLVEHLGDEPPPSSRLVQAGEILTAERSPCCR